MCKGVNIKQLLIQVFLTDEIMLSLIFSYAHGPYQRAHGPAWKQYLDCFIKQIFSCEEK
jgi:hypothetical protein